MGRLNQLRPIGLRHFLRCRIRLRIRRSCAPLCDVLYLVDDWPYFLLWRHRDITESARNETGNVCAS